MLAKAERIISEHDVLINKSQEEIFDIVRRELARRIADDCVSKGLIKVEIANERSDDFGMICKVRATLRVYHPDD